LTTTFCLSPFFQRNSESPGGAFEDLDAFRKGRVQVIENSTPLYEAVLVLEEILNIRKLNADATWDQFAVVSRNKADLDPVRALLESKGIPVDWRANTDSLPSPFRIREIHTWLLKLYKADKEMWNSDTLSDLLAKHICQHGNNPWCELLYAVAEEWKVEAGEGEFPVRFLREFTVEALQELRQEKRSTKGVVLANAHRVKGLEFPHVLILSPHWKTMGTLADIEEERRLYYVAMTRAEQTLTLFQNPTLRKWLECLEGPSLLRREWAPSPEQEQCVDAFSNLRYDIIGLEEVFISYAGLRSPGTRIHKALQSLKTGSPVSLIHNSKGIVLRAENGVDVASLSAKGRTHWESRLERIEKIETKAIVTRYKDEGETPNGMTIRSDAWEIPVVEVAWRKDGEGLLVQQVAEEPGGYFTGS